MLLLLVHNVSLVPVYVAVVPVQHMPLPAEDDIPMLPLQNVPPLPLHSIPMLPFHILAMQPLFHLVLNPMVHLLCLPLKDLSLLPLEHLVTLVKRLLSPQISFPGSINQSISLGKCMPTLQLHLSRIKNRATPDAFSYRLP